MKKILFLMILAAAAGSLAAQELRPALADSRVSFVIKNMGLDVEGTLSGLKGRLFVDPKNTAHSAFDMTVDVNTINTKNAKRDKHLQAADFFDAEKFPVIRIHSTKITHKGGNAYFANAVLTIKNISKNIGFTFEAKPMASGYVFTGGFTINRRDFGVGGSSMTMADQVKVTLVVAGTK